MKVQQSLPGVNGAVSARSCVDPNRAARYFHCARFSSAVRFRSYISQTTPNFVLAAVGIESSGKTSLHLAFATAHSGRSKEYTKADVISFYHDS